MAKKMKKALAMFLAVLMLTSTMSMPVFAEETETEGTAITGTITEDTVWNDGDVVGPLTISGGTKDNPITITVNGTVTVLNQIKVTGADDSHVVFTGNGTLIRGASNNGCAVIWSEGNYRVWNSIVVDGITLDGGADWTGEEHATLKRGTTNSGLSASGSGAIMFVRYSDVTLKNAIVQNQYTTSAKAAAINVGYGRVVIDNSIIRNNYHGSERGGAIHMRNGATVIAEDSAFYGNHGNQGGVIGTSGSDAYASVMEFTDCSFTNNYANSGAVFHVQNNLFPIGVADANKTPADWNYKFIGDLKVTGCTITNNGSSNKGRGLVDSSSYHVPVYFVDCEISNNDCNLFGCFSNHNENLYVSGSDISTSYEGSLTATPIKVTGPLGSMVLNQKTIDALMNDFGYVAAGTEGYDITEADVAKLFPAETTYYYYMADVNGDGYQDVVVGEKGNDGVEVVVVDGFPGSKATEKQTVKAGQYPVCNFDHPGYVLNAWVESTNDEGAKVMTAQWKVAVPEDVTAVISHDSVVGLDTNYTVSIDEIGNFSDDVTYSYQWYHEKGLIAGATSPTLTTNGNECGGEYGWHYYTCEVRANKEGCASTSIETAVSNTVRVKILPEPEVEPVCYIEETGVYYPTLTEAVDKANELPGDNTIVMIKDIDYDYKPATAKDEKVGLTVSGNLTIVSEEGTNHVISRGGYTGALFTVPADASLTLGGGIVFDGSNNWVFDEDAYNAALKAEVIVENISSFVTPEQGGTVAAAPMFVVNGAVVAKDASFQNNYSGGSSNSGQYGIFQVLSNASLTMTGTTVSHVATNGASTIAYLATNAKWTINEGTELSDNVTGKNGGLCRNDRGQIYMNGGIIKDNHAVNASGHVFMMYEDGSYFEMNGGTICNNSSLPGTSNAIRTAAIYLHSKAKMVMNDGAICHNSGWQCGGIVSKKNVGSDLVIKNGFFTENVSTSVDEPYDVQTNGNAAAIYGGIYMQDVDEYCAQGYVCIPYDRDMSEYVYMTTAAPEGYNENTRDDDFIVVPGLRVNYYSVEQVEGTDPEAGAPTAEYKTTLLKKYFHMLPRDKYWYEMDERANYFELTDEKGGVISTWYTEKELNNKYDFANTKLEGNLDLYGEFEYTDEAAVVLTIDMSGTMYRYKMGGKRYVDVAKAKALDFVNQYAAKVTEEGDVRMLAIASFDTDAKVVLNWVDVSTADGLAAAKKAINNMKVRDNGSTSSNNVCTNFDGGVILTRNLLKQATVSEIDNKFAIILSDGAPTVTVNSDTDTVGTIKSSFLGKQLDMNGKQYQNARAGGGWTHPGEVDRTLRYLGTGSNNLADQTTSYGENKEGIFFIGVGGDMTFKLFNDAVNGTSNGTRTTDVKKKPAAFNYVEALQGIAQADILKMTTADWLTLLADKVGGTYVSAKDESGLKNEFDAILTAIVNS